MPMPCLIDIPHRDAMRQRACKDKTHDRFLLYAVAHDMVTRLQEFQKKPQSVVIMDDALGVLGDQMTHACPQILPAASRGDVAMNLLGLDYASGVSDFFCRAKTSLYPEGLLMVTTFGSQTLTALKEALYHNDMYHHQGAGLRFMPTMAPPDLAKLATQAGFFNPVVDAHRYKASYQSCLDLMHDLRAMALGNALKARCRRPLMRHHLNTLTRDLPYGEDGRFWVTFEILTLVAHL